MLATWQGLAGMLDTLLYSEVPGLVMMAFLTVWVYKLHVSLQRLAGLFQRLEERVGNLEGAVQRLDERGEERHREFKEHERVCADRWAQVQRELGAIHTAVGTPYAPISLKPPQPES